MRVCIIIPALNEAQAITKVVRDIPSFVDRIIVVDNGSTDGTGELANAAGADIVRVDPPGYGRACLAGVNAAGDADIFVFMDGDGADHPGDMEKILAPILNGDADFVLGSRLTGDVQQGALTLPQRFGNALASFLMKLFWGGTFTDLGPFRAITKTAYQRLNMQAPTYGWTVEMQVRALKSKLRYREIPVRYRRRIGVSKISGTVKGVILAGGYILGVIFRELVVTHKPAITDEPS